MYDLNKLVILLKENGYSFMGPSDAVHIAYFNIKVTKEDIFMINGDEDNAVVPLAKDFTKNVKELKELMDIIEECYFEKKEEPKNNEWLIRIEDHYIYNKKTILYSPVSVGPSHKYRKIIAVLVEEQSNDH